MAITPGAATTASAFSTAVTVAKPAGTVAGDDLLFIGITQGSAALVNGGFTQTAQGYGLSGVAPCRGVVARRRVTDDDADTTGWTFTAGTTAVHIAGILLRLSGGSPALVHKVAIATGSSGGSPVCPSITPTINGGLLVAVGTTTPYYNNQGAASIHSVPAGMTDRGYTGSTYACGRVATQQLASNAATGTRSFAGSGASWVGISLVLSDNQLPTAPDQIRWLKNNPDDADGVIAVGEVNRLIWRHNDPDGDPEEAAEIRYRQQSTLDWTTVARSAAGYYDLPADEIFPAPYELQVHTADDEGYGGWSESMFFTAATRPPPPSWVDPIDGGTINGPLVTVTLTHPGDPDRVQVQDRSTDGTVLHHDTGSITYADDVPVQFPTATNGQTVELRSRARQDGLWSTWAPIAVDVDYTDPPAAIVALIPDEPDGAITVAWLIPAPTGSQPTPVEARVWRRSRRSDTGWDPPVRIARGLDPADQSWIDRSCAGVPWQHDYQLEVIADTTATSMSEWADADAVYAHLYEETY